MLKVIALEDSPENFLVKGRVYTVLTHKNPDTVTLRDPVSNMTTVVKRTRVEVVSG